MGRLTTVLVILELSLARLETPAEMLLVEGKHVSVWEDYRDVCASRFGTSRVGGC